MNEIEQRLHELVKDKSYFQYCGLSVHSAELDKVCIVTELRPEICNSYGVIHGGYLMSMADHVAGLTALTDGRFYVTQNSNLQFLSNVMSGKIYATGNVLRRGRQITSVQVNITSESGKLLCTGLFSMFTVEKNFTR